MSGQGSCETDSVFVCDWNSVSKNLLAEDGSPLFSDARISCGDEAFDVHRYVLAAFSPYLKRSFIAHQEQSPGTPLVLPGEFVTKESFALILDLIYKGQITIDGDNVLRLHSAGNYLEIDQVTNKCADFIVKGLSVDCVVSVWDYACKVTANANRLLKKAVRFMGENFSELVKHDTVLALKKGELCLLLSQLRNVDDENLVLEVVLGWLGHDWNGRFKDCEEVLSRVLWQCVDYARCHDGMLARINASVDGNSPDQMQAVTAITSKVCDVPGETLSHANVYDLIFEEGRLVFRKLSISIQEHKNKNMIRTRKRMRQERDNFPTVSIGEPRQIQPVMGYVLLWFFAFQGRLLAVLWHKGDEQFSRGFMLAVVSENGDSKVVAQLAVLEIDNCDGRFLEITSHGGLLSIFLHRSDNTYALAAYDIRKFGRRLAFDDGEVFAIPFFAQTTGLAETNCYSTSSAFNTDVYFFGGSNEGFEEAIHAKVLHLPDQTWSELPCLQNYRNYPAVVFIDRSFFVVGGRKGDESVSNAAEMLSMDAPTAWTQLPGLRNERYYGCHLISCGHFLIAFGGRNGNDEDVEKAEILNLRNLAKGWEEYPPLHGIDPEFVVKV